MAYCNGKLPRLPLGSDLERRKVTSMDEIDRKLLGLLQKDGRRASADLAKEIGLSVSATNERVRKLIETGIVRAVEAVVAPQKVGITVTAFVFVDLDYTDTKNEEEFVSRIKQTPQVLELHHVTGQHSYLLKIREKTNADLDTFMTRVLKKLPYVRATETLIALNTDKETTNLPL